MPASTVVPAGMFPDFPDCSFLSAQNSLNGHHKIKFMLLTTENIAPMYNAPLVTPPQSNIFRMNLYLV